MEMVTSFTFRWREGMTERLENANKTWLQRVKPLLFSDLLCVKRLFLHAFFTIHAFVAAVPMPPCATEMPQNTFLARHVSQPST